MVVIVGNMMSCHNLLFDELVKLEGGGYPADDEHAQCEVNAELAPVIRSAPCTGHRQRLIAHKVLECRGAPQLFEVV